MTSLGSGTISRTEIVQMTVAKMLSYCKYPTSAQCDTVASKIVSNLLKGKGDAFGNGHVCTVLLQFYTQCYWHYL